MPRSRRTLLGTLSLVAAAVAGCVSGDDAVGTAASPAATTIESAETSTPTETPRETLVASTPSETPKTSAGIGTGDNPVDVQVSGEIPEGRTLTIAVRRRGADEPVLEATVTAESTTRSWDLFHSGTTGVYVLTATLNGAEATAEWDLSDSPEGGWYSIFIEDDGSLSWSYAIA